MPVKAVLFDKDGTLVDVQRTLGPAFAAILRELAGGDPSLLARLAAVCGYDLGLQRLRPNSPIAPNSPATLSTIIAPVLGVPGDANLLQRLHALTVRETARTLTAAPNARAVIGLLRERGLVLGVSTNAAANHAREELDRIGVLRDLSFLAGFNSGFGSKPDPGQVLAFARAADCAPQEVLCVGDSLYDLQAAHAAGALAVALIPPHDVAADMRRLADHVIASLADLPPILDTLVGAERA